MSLSRMHEQFLVVFDRLLQMYNVFPEEIGKSNNLIRTWW